MSTDFSYEEEKRVIREMVKLHGWPYMLRMLSIVAEDEPTRNLDLSDELSHLADQTE